MEESGVKLYRIVVPMFHMQIVESENPDHILDHMRAYVSGAFRNEIRSGELVVGWDSIKLEAVTEEQLRREIEDYENDTPDLQQEYGDYDEYYEPTDDSLT